MVQNTMKNVFEGKKIVVGITGSIAAYKSLFLIRELVRKGAEVFPVLTPSATNFVTELATSNLSRNSTIVDMFDKSYQSKGAWHIDLVHQCDLMIIAPCSAATLGKIANGICDNALVTLAIALPRNVPLLIAPAMDTSMWENPATQRNAKTLLEQGAVIIPPAKGELSSGLYGEGRLPELPVLLDYIQTYLYLAEISTERKANLLKIKGKNILISAGPTQEKIDDVRFISNFSSGKMGYAIASSACSLGGNVTLVSGPSCLTIEHNLKLVKVVSSNEMLQALKDEFLENQIVIMSSAVADFTPKIKSSGKIKKEKSEELVLNLIKTPDILSELGRIKKNQVLVGFALEESSEGLFNAWKKLKQKNCDLIVLNYIDREQSGFAGDFNTITVMKFKSENEMNINYYEPMEKSLCAMAILEEIAELL
jgi:phosphopantothenoylcysteine decarboxylase/phosphopantothenate--cysteine ligase